MQGDIVYIITKIIKYIECIGTGIAFISLFVALGLISYFGIFN